MPLSVRGNRMILDTGSPAEVTRELSSPSADTVPFVIDAADSFYVGFRGKFAYRHFNFSVLNSNSVTLAIAQWDGDSWEDVADIMDETNGFTQNGFVHWTNNDVWKAHAEDPVAEELFWVRFKVSGALSALTALQSVLSIFCDDAIMRTYYPEIISDTRYLPPGRTDFLEQYVQARNQVVLRLRQRRAIDDEDQIIDITEYQAAAAHKTAEIILSPIDRESDFLERAQDAFGNEVNELARAADLNRDGKVSSDEKRNISQGEVVRR